MKHIRTIIAFIVGLVPLLAQAQAINNLSGYQPASSSKAMQILGSIFGSLGTFGANGGDPLAAVIGNFNGACLAVGGIMVAYGMLVGVVGTAHEGEVFGKKIHSSFYPLRLIVGTSLVLPVSAAGYSVVNYIVASIIALSIGIGDKAWATFASSGNLSNVLSAGLIRPDSKLLGYTLLENYVCINAMNKINADPSHVVLGGSNSHFGVTYTTEGTNSVWNFGDTAAVNGFKATTCGKLTIKTQQNPVEFPVSNGIWQSSSSKAEAQQRQKRIMDAQQTQVTALANKMNSYAQQLVSSLTLDPSVVDQAVSDYELAVRDAAAAEIQNIQAFKEVSDNASQDGFVGAALFYNKLMNMSDIVYRSMADVPSAARPNINVSAMWWDEYLKYYAPLMEAISKSEKGQLYGIQFQRGASQDGMGKSSWTDIFTNGFDANVVLKSMFTHDKSSLVLQQNEHPVLAMSRIGRWMLAIGAGIQVTGITAMAVAELPGIVQGIAEGMRTVSVPMIICGFILGYYVAFRPFIHILSALIGWVLQCIEAVIISSLWATQHLTTGGEEMTGGAANGYRLLLNILFKPVLIVFAVIVSIVLLPIFGNFLAIVFNDLFISSIEDSNVISTLFAEVASVFIFGAVVYKVIDVIFSIITTLPDTVLQWVTGSENKLGKIGGEMGGNAAIAGVLGGLQTVGTAAGQIGQGAHQGVVAKNAEARQHARDEMMDQKQASREMARQDQQNQNRQEANDREARQDQKWEQRQQQQEERGWMKMTQENAIVDSARFGENGSNTVNDPQLAAQYKEQSSIPPSANQMKSMNDLASKYGVQFSEADTASRASANEWLKNTLKQNEPETYFSIMNKRGGR